MEEPLEKVDASEPFVRWFIVRFSTREHFIRFLSLVILLITVHWIWKDKPMPEGWWGVFGMVIGYYFRGGSGCGKE